MNLKTREREKKRAWYSFFFVLTQQLEHSIEDIWWFIDFNYFLGKFPDDARACDIWFIIIIKNKRQILMKLIIITFLISWFRFFVNWKKNQNMEYSRKLWLVFLFLPVLPSYATRQNTCMPRRDRTADIYQWLIGKKNWGKKCNMEFSFYFNIKCYGKLIGNK